MGSSSFVTHRPPVGMVRGQGGKHVARTLVLHDPLARRSGAQKIRAFGDQGERVEERGRNALGSCAEGDKLETGVALKNQEE